MAARGGQGSESILAKHIMVFFTAKAEAEAAMKKINVAYASSRARPTLMTHKHVLRTTLKGRECLRAIVRE